MVDTPKKRSENLSNCRLAPSGISFWKVGCNYYTGNMIFHVCSMGESGDTGLDSNLSDLARQVDRNTQIKMPKLKFMKHPQVLLFKWSLKLALAA